MIGLMFFGALFAYIGLLYWIFFRVRDPYYRVTLAAFAIGIPFWDLPIGLAVFLQRCNDSGFVEVSKPIETPRHLSIKDGFSRSPRDFLLAGYESVEYVGDKYSPSRWFLLTGRDEVGERFGGSPKPQLQLRIAHQTQMSWYSYRSSAELISVPTGEAILRGVTIRWLGGWLQHSFPLVRPVDVSCHKSATNEVIRATLAIASPR